MLVSWIVSDQQGRGRVVHITHAGRRIRFSMKRGCKGGEVSGAVVIDIVSGEGDTSELLQQIVLFVCCSCRADYTNCLAAIALKNPFESLSDVIECLFPSCGSQPSPATDQRLRESVFVIYEIERVASFDAEKIAVDSALVAIIAAYDLHAGIRSAHAERRLASIAAMRTGCADVIHFPWASLVPI